MFEDGGLTMSINSKTYGWQSLGPITDHHIKEDALLIECGNAALRISPEESGSIRVRLSQSGIFGRDHSWAVWQDASDAPSWQFKEDDAFLYLITEAVRVVIRIGRGFSHIEHENGVITAGAGATDINVARKARDEGLSGLEFLSGIPGTIGGGLRMNAGAYGREFRDVVIDACALDGEGNRHRLDLDALGLAYRQCAIDEDWIFVSARLAGEPGDKADITRRMEEIGTEREKTQPVKTPTGGSTFANPEGAKAWELIDKAGCRGLTRGGAKVSELHCNFLINTGKASAADLEGLGEEVRRRVMKDSGVMLEWEIRRLGRHKEGLT